MKVNTNCRFQFLIKEKVQVSRPTCKVEVLRNNLTIITVNEV